MKRIRINNDFTFAWAIERNGLPEDLSSAINMVLKVRNSAGAIQVITDYDVTGNIVSVEVTPEIANVLGRYVFILTYELPDAGLSDLERLCEIDTDAFILVPRTAEADDSADMLVTSDMAIGFKGDSAYQLWLDAGNTGTVEDYLEDIKGDPFLYSDFTPEQIAELQQPATTAAAELTETVNNKMTDVDIAEGLRATSETSRQGNETVRVQAESDRNAAEGLRLSDETTREQNEQARETAEGLRITAEQTRQINTSTAITNANNAATNANTKAGLADAAANNANAKATLANDAATNANEKAGLANIAATNADNAASAISPAVINNEQVQAETYNVLNARISALEAIIEAGVYNYIQADTLIGVQSMKYKGAEMILTGTAAPAIAPDFVGQIFVNTTGGVTYMAKGIASAADWKQTSN